MAQREVVAVLGISKETIEGRLSEDAYHSIGNFDLMYVSSIWSLTLASTWSIAFIQILIWNISLDSPCHSKSNVIFPYTVLWPNNCSSSKFDIYPTTLHEIFDSLCVDAFNFWMSLNVIPGPWHFAYFPSKFIWDLHCSFQSMYLLYFHQYVLISPNSSCGRLHCMIIDVNVQRAESVRTTTSCSGQSAKTFSVCFYCCFQ